MDAQQIKNKGADEQEFGQKFCFCCLTVLTTQTFDGVGSLLRARRHETNNPLTIWPDLYDLIVPELTIKGIYCYQDEEWQGETVHDFALALRLLEEGKVDLSRLVTHRFRLDQWHDALRAALEKGRHKAVKVAFVPA